MSKKILLLGGSHGQIPAINEAKRRGLYTILCDYLSDNPGKDLVDKFYLVSTTDKEKVLEVARENQVDYILAYGSDPAVLTAAYVEKKMGMKGNSPESIELLNHKDQFRKFQHQEGFQAPRFRVLTKEKNGLTQSDKDLLPAVVKPVDSSDTKGVTLVKKFPDLQKSIENAFKFTRCGRVIIEEQVTCERADLNGDGFVIDGELRFCELGDHLYTSVSEPLKPSSTLFPSQNENDLIVRVKNILVDMIQKSGYKNGPMNVEVRVNSQGEIYVMEIGPRNGGSYIPQAIFYSTGFNLLEALFDSLMGRDIHIFEKEKTPVIGFTLHSNTGGIFDSFEMANDLKPFVVEKNIYLKSGEPVKPYDKPASSIGALVFRFENMQQLHEHLDSFYEKVLEGVHFKEQ